MVNLKIYKRKATDFEAGGYVYDVQDTEKHLGEIIEHCGEFYFKANSFGRALSVEQMEAVLDKMDEMKLEYDKDINVFERTMKSNNSTKDMDFSKSKGDYKNSDTIKAWNVWKVCRSANYD